MRGCHVKRHHRQIARLIAIMMFSPSSVRVRVCRACGCPGVRVCRAFFGRLCVAAMGGKRKGTDSNPDSEKPQAKKIAGTPDAMVVPAVAQPAGAQSSSSSTSSCAPRLPPEQDRPKSGSREFMKTCIP